MVLLLDNYDSFTYNLVDYIAQLGYECKVFRNDEISIAEISKLDQLEAIVLSPGPGIPKNAGIMVSVIKHFHRDIPILGICLGHQAIGEYFDSKLIKAKTPIHGKTSSLFFEKHFLFKNIENSFEVMRYHSLVLKEIKKPLRVIAKTQENEIMALAHNSLPIVGIQFHPESILTENGLLLLKNFFDHIKKDFN